MNARMSLSTPKVTPRFIKAGFSTPFALLHHVPTRYMDESKTTPIARLQDGQYALCQGVVIKAGFRGRVYVVTLQDATGQLRLVFFSVQKWHMTQLQLHREIRVAGTPQWNFHTWSMSHPNLIDPSTPHKDHYTAIYPSTQGLTSPIFARAIARLLQSHFRDPLPRHYRTKLQLPSYQRSLQRIHMPSLNRDLALLNARATSAWERLKFDELLAQQIALLEQRSALRSRRSTPLPATHQSLEKQFLSQLPFTLTGAQKRVAQEIARDLRQRRPTQRLVQGDVGCGKTIIAVLAILQAIHHGKQAVLMAPTTILAQQHYQKIQHWLAPLGITVELLIAGQSPRMRQETLTRIAQGQTQVIIGTHALIQDSVTYKNLVLCIIDRQHRFGVLQRQALLEKGRQQNCPHQILMSATPIPRTLAMSYLADLDVSVIDELPPNRSPIDTRTISLQRLPRIYPFLQKAFAQGHQAYWICPLIEESETLNLTAVQDRFNDLQARLPQARIALLHGKTPATERDAIMHSFAQGRIQLLIATTVIEVGVDVPNACIMIIEHAQQFGLAQLHQLRGRVGRGAKQSYCILLHPQELTEDSKYRLRVIRNTTDGFEVARQDLALRGPGDFLGERQSGAILLHFANLETDRSLLQKAKNVAIHWLNENSLGANAFSSLWKRYNISTSTIK